MMKTLMIETVTNGWIVRPFTPCRDWGNVDQGIIAVYNNLVDLQSDLPRLLDAVIEASGGSEKCPSV